MVEGDCGQRCEQYCCRAADAVKYLLPGEEQYYETDPPPNFEIFDHSLFIGYRSQELKQCACTREKRPFCCRIFPFRPVIDSDHCRVSSIKKATGAGFDIHCWVNEPLKEWRERAVEAWRFVLSDQDNLRFYARYALFLKEAKMKPALSSSSTLYDVAEIIERMSEKDFWREAAALFDILGSPPQLWRL